MKELDPKKHSTPFSFFLATNRKEIKWIVLNCVLYAGGSGANIFAVYYLGKIVDALTSHTGNLKFLIGALIVSFFANEIFYRIGHVFEVTVDARIRQSAKRTLFDYSTKLSFGYFADHFAGQISHQVSTIADSLEEMKVLVVGTFIDNTWMLIVSAVTLTAVYPLLGIVLLVWTIIFIFVLRPFTKKITASAEKFAEDGSLVTGALVDTYSNIATVKVYSKDFDRQRIYDSVDREYKSQLRLGKWDILTYAYQGISSIILLCALLAITGYGYVHGAITLGQIVLIVGIGLKINENIYGIGHGASSFIRLNGECSQALKDILVIPAIVDGKEKIDESWKSIAVTYSNVSFEYSNGKKILEDFFITIPAAQKVGVVGLSGAGKTTLVNLLLRFFDPQSGTITFNGIDIKTVSQDSLRSHISFISQDTSLFHTTIAENISYGSSNVSREEIERVGKMAYADDFISALPKGYDTIVGERGVKLSGGQRQRIAIARAMLKNSPLFILDEATSALDSDSEGKVQEALTELMKGKTVIAIAHRLSTLQSMDRIVFLEEGKIVEDGTHQELLAQGGKYAALWKMQSGGFLPDIITDTKVIS